MNDFCKMLMLALSILLASCGQQTSVKKPQQTVTVKPENLHKTLYFTGTIRPLSERTLSTPMGAVVHKMHYHYGQFVKKGETVFTLNSSELETQYNSTLTDYLKAKDSYNIARSKFVGIEDLRREGLVSKNNYLSERSNVNTARVNLIQATRKLTDLLSKMGDASQDTLSGLSFAEFEKVRLALTRKHNRLYVKASSDGILLYPPNSDASVKSINVGSSVKTGEVLALIGDLTGIRVEIDVPEVDIDKIKPGMTTLIRTTTYPNEVLEGKLVAINAQASTSSSSTLPSFTAVVEVQHLNERQQNWIKVGMSAAIEIPVDNANKLMIPLNALHEEEGKLYVSVRLGNGTVQKKSITTGMVSNNKIAVESGLQKGDVIVYG